MNQGQISLNLVFSFLPHHGNVRSVRTMTIVTFVRTIFYIFIDDFVSILTFVLSFPAAVWQGIIQWLGITNSVDLDEALPNRNSFSNLFGKEDLFESDTTCSDNTDTFTATKSDPNGWVKQKTCAGWVNRKSTAWRCYNVGGVKENCPRTCTNCCVENEGTFTLLGNGKNKTCTWAQANPGPRCGKPPTRQNCAVTCGQCD